MGLQRALAFALGVGLDARFGDPPNRWHPVAVIGPTAHALRIGAPAANRDRERYGLAVALALPALAALATAGTRGLGGRLLGAVGRVAADAAVLDATFALHTLLARAEEIAALLETGDLERAREALATHLVSRDTSTLSAADVAGATIESVAENLSDSVVAPWLAFAVAGAPGAAAYRVSNTLDALWGYRTPEFEALGHAAARLDDALNYIPARVTGAALVVAAATRASEGFSGPGAVGGWYDDRARTASPNAGHPMAAMAGALGVELRKYGVYTLSEGMRRPTQEDIGRAVSLARTAATIVGGALLGALLVTGSR